MEGREKGENTKGTERTGLLPCASAYRLIGAETSSGEFLPQALGGEKAATVGFDLYKFGKEMG